MKLKLWRIHYQSPYYSGDHENVTVHAPNVKCAIDRANKIVSIYRLNNDTSKTKAIENIELIGVAENN